MNFKNTSKRVVKGDESRWNWSDGSYTYDHVPEYLIFYGRFFQSVVSQVGTYLLTGKFHDQEVGIYKCEGGCRIAGVGDLVLGDRMCYFDSYGSSEKSKKNTEKMANLITELALAFDPMNPFDSVITKASEIIKVSKEEIEKAISKNGANPFSGDALSNFFRRNPFDTSRRVSEEYERWARINVYKQDPKDVDEVLEYDKKSHKLLKAINEKINSRKDNPAYLHAMCCSPSKLSDGWKFWINTGRSTNIDYWKTEEEISAFLSGDGKVTLNK